MNANRAIVVSKGLKTRGMKLKKVHYIEAVERVLP